MGDVHQYLWGVLMGVIVGVITPPNYTHHTMYVRVRCAYVIAYVIVCDNYERSIEQLTETSHRHQPHQRTNAPTSPHNYITPITPLSGNLPANPIRGSTFETGLPQPVALRLLVSGRGIKKHHHVL